MSQELDIKPEETISITFNSGVGESEVEIIDDPSKPGWDVVVDSPEPDSNEVNPSSVKS